MSRPHAGPPQNAVATAAAAAGLHIEIVEYPEGTRTAEDAARAIGCDVAQIVKSLVFEAVGPGADRLVLALVSGANQLDTAKLASAAAAERTRRVDADRVRAATGFAIGGVPPFAHREALGCYVDEQLLAHPVLWAAAGTPRSVFAIAPGDLVTLSAGVVCDLRQD